MTNNALAENNQRMLQLDGLRAIAVCLVFVQHWHWGLPDFFTSHIHVGAIGVQLFFVLSGFLITGILLTGREYVESGHQSAAFTIRQFYVRRFLRIFPLYYAMLFFLASLGALGFSIAYVGVTSVLGWHLLYLTNVMGVVNGKIPQIAGHFWTLAVEEQFYLIWPTVILFIPSRWLKWAILAMIGISLLYRGLGSPLGLSEIAVGRQTPTYLTTLGSGALLAYANRNCHVEQVGRWLDRVVLIGLFLMLLGYLRRWPWNIDPVTALAEGIGTPIVFCWLVFRAACGFGGLFGAFLQTRIVKYLGRISYGLYVIHYPLPFLYREFSRHIYHLPQTLLVGGHAASFFLYAMTANVLASLSWFFFESPINRLKAGFPYRKQNVETQLTPVVVATEVAGDARSAS